MDRNVQVTEVNKLYISGRERRIAEILLENQQVVTIKQLADELEVSNRTIHRDLKNVEEILAKDHVTLTRKSGLGLGVSGEDKNIHALQTRLGYTKYTDYRPEERQIVILLNLLKANGPLKLQTLASELQVTNATISYDLDSIQKTLDKYQLNLIRRRGYGVEIVGDEQDKRSALSQLMTDHIDEFQFITLLRDEQERKEENNIGMISNRLLGIVNPEKLQIIEQEVNEVIASLPYELADSAYIGLIVHLALAIERLNQGDIIQFDTDYLQQIQMTKEYKIARKMIESLEKALEMDIPVDEIGYITMHLMGAKLKNNDSYLIQDTNFDIAYQAKKLIHYVARAVNEDIQDNERLLNDLVAHLQPTIYRLQQKMIIKNPLIDEVMRDYSELFEIVESGVVEAFPEIDFPKEEIGYLVLHFGAVLLHSKKNLGLHALVICPSGIGTAKMLGENLLQKIPEIKQIDNKSIFELDQTEKNKYDLIVSTIPLQGNNDYILASPILSKQDIMNINKAVRLKKVNQSIVKKEDNKVTGSNIVAHLQALRNHSEAMLTILANFYIGKIEKDLLIAEALGQICKELMNKGILKDEHKVLEDLLAREEVSGLGIPGTELALYHTRSSGVHEVSFSIYNAGNSYPVIGMDGKEMEIKRILLMIAPEESNQQALEVISFISGLIISNETTTQLFETGTETEIHSLISSHLSDFHNTYLLQHRHNL